MFYSPRNIRHEKIVIDQAAVSCDSPEVQKRLNRIEENYAQLESILGDLEDKMNSDDRLKTLDDDNADFELAFGIKRKRKWRPAKSKILSKRKRRTRVSADPKKPR